VLRSKLPRHEAKQKKMSRYKKPKKILFRLVQIGKAKRTNGWNLMFGKTFIRSFHWSKPDEAIECCRQMNNLIDGYPAELEIIITPSAAKRTASKYQWVHPPKDNYLGNNK
jgi:hypothetical protein